MDPPAAWGEAPSVGDAKSNAIIMHDSDVYWANKVADVAYSDDQERKWLAASFRAHSVPIWQIGRRAAAFVQMYDLLAPIDSCRAGFYLERVRVIACELLKWRDDKLTGEFGEPSTAVDSFRGRVMAAWGGAGPDRDYRWNTDVVVAGVFTYPMAAFARRIAANPSAFGTGYQQDAIHFTTAVMETYNSFRPDMWLPGTTNTWAYYILPQSYTTLQCNLPNAGGCSGYKANAGQPISWNENLSFMKSLAEVAMAADSQLYRSSPDSPAKLFALSHATDEVPRLIAKNVRFFVDHLNSAGHKVTWSDGAVGYVWNHEYHAPGNPQIQNTPHGQFELGSIGVIYENQAMLDGLLVRANRPERIGLSAAILQRFATTFLRKMWIYDYNHAEPRNRLAGRVDGNSDIVNGQPVYRNDECAGFVPLTQVDPWVWIRCRDVTAKSPGYWREDNYAALLRYR
jgi:hypothetical protein